MREFRDVMMLLDFIASTSRPVKIKKASSCKEEGCFRFKEYCFNFVDNYNKQEKNKKEG